MCFFVKGIGEKYRTGDKPIYSKCKRREQIENYFHLNIKFTRNYLKMHIKVPYDAVPLNVLSCAALLVSLALEIA